MRRFSEMTTIELDDLACSLAEKIERQTAGLNALARRNADQSRLQPIRETILKLQNKLDRVDRALDRRNG